MFHVSAPYDANGKVFVHVQHKEWGKVWKRVRADKADQKRVIRCCTCDKPAVSLDHLWPYHSEMNRCADHVDTPYSEDLDTANTSLSGSSAPRGVGEIIHSGQEPQKEE
jgi:hypothetical protein